MENLETQRTNNNDPRGMESVDGYVSTLFFLSNTEKNVMQIKKRLMQYAEQNKMTFLQVRTAEIKALANYALLDPAFVVSNVPLEPEILDIIKYIRVLDILNNFNNDEKIKNAYAKWNSMIHSLIPRMNDVNHAVLKELISINNLGLHNYLNK